MFRGKLILAVCVIIISVSFTSFRAHAGPFTDDLAKCLVESTSTRDREAFVRWMFAAMATHPAVQSIYSITPQQMDDANRVMGGLSMKLITESCAVETKKAIQYEGESAISGSFEVLGKVAAQGLFADPSVMEALSGLEQYFNEEELLSVFQFDDSE